MNKKTKYMNVEWKDNSPKPFTSHDVMYAGEEEEFFYKKDDTAVPEGEAIGLDIDRPHFVDLMLFSDIYWSPSVSS